MAAECLVLNPDELFHPPAQSDAIDHLVAEYQAALFDIVAISEVMCLQGNKVLPYFAEGSRIHFGNDRYQTATAFNREWAVAALNADYWQKAIHLTDVLNYMPQKRRDEWNKAIKDHTTPEFAEDTVRATITQLLFSREQFFAERVDGVFRALSGEHVTNSPQGFNRRMILNRVYDAKFGFANHSQIGYINDLRAIIAKFMGRDEPEWYLTSRTLDKIPKDGQWRTLDGGAIRVRLYKIGTAHVEVHPEMAWRLNCVLATLFPQAIPAKFRAKPLRPSKEFNLMQKPLPNQVLNVLSDLGHGKSRWSRTLRHTANNELKKQAVDVLKALGGVESGPGEFEFEYDPGCVINEVVVSGCIPDHKSHQYYPTPRSLAEMAVDLAKIADDHSCLEPSAGQAGLADLMPKDRTDCVEISALHCKILEAKGFKTFHTDFLKWDGINIRYDRVLLNPPFSEGRWKAHLEHAANFVKTGGKIVAILPASAQSFALNDFECIYHGPFENEFVGTGVSVVILVADKI